MTNVEENAQGAYSAKTEAHGDGTKTISIGRDALADGSRFGMNILLAHESYRNGVNDGEAGQRKETDQAVLGHINTALALGQIYGMNSLSSLQANEVNTYVAAIKSGQYGELAKILNSYDARGDYWRVLKDKDGNVTKVLDDSDRENVTIVEADGTERKVKLRTGSVSGAIAIAVGNGMTPEQMNKIMVRSGLDWTEEKGWYAKDENAKYTVHVTKVTSSQSSFLDQIKEWSSGAVNQVGNWLTSLKAEIKNIIVKNVSTNQEKKNDKATFEIVGNDGIPLTLNSINTDNPIISQLIKQNDVAFNDIPEIAEGGCNFRVVQAYCEMLAGKALTTDQIKQLWKATAGTSIMDSDGYVRDPDGLADKTLSALGRTDFGLTFGGDWRKNGTLIGYRIGMPYKSEYHYALGDIYKSLVFNPGSTNTTADNWRNVYVYPKK